VRCSNCEHENREGRKFCASCGSALPVLCRDCGFANEPFDRFCGGCGRPLVTAGTTAKEEKHAAEPGGDRRPVTVLFCDLVGYTRLSSLLDPEDVHALLQRFFALVDATVDRFGGTIDKHIGDAAMALFGAPLARGNDPERAVRAALEIQDSVATLASGLPSALAVHIGMATGEVVASSIGSQHHRQYTVIGEAANVAARLLDRAGAGEIFVSDAVYRATSHVVSYDAVGSLVLKGVTHPVHAWRPTGLRSARPDVSALAGRRSEVGQLRAVLNACVNGTSGGAVLIRGEAGIGKTRLTEELRSIAIASGMICIAGSVLNYGAARGYDVVRTVVAGLLGFKLDAAVEATENAIDSLLQAGQLQPDDSLYLRDLLEIPHSAATRKLYEAMDAASRKQGKDRVVTALVQFAADRGSLLITVEDVHWADAETLNLLVAISRATALSRTVLVMTTRLGDDRFEANWRGFAGEQTTLTINLSPLSLEEAQSIAGRFADVSAFAEQCVERAGGNPLFLEQLLRGARDLTDGRLPASIQSVVLARTDLLSAADRRAIQAASVLGQHFSLSNLRTLLQDPIYACDTLLRNALLRQTQDGLQFVHALVREGVYGSLTNARKRQLHCAAAPIFSDNLVLEADHLDRGGDAKAATAYVAAARMQASLFRHDQAIELAARGLVIATQGRDAFELAVLLGDLQREAGHGTEALEAYLRALRESGEEVDQCRSLIGCAAANRLIDRGDDALVALAEAEPLARRSDDNCALAEVHCIRGNLYFSRGRLIECRCEHELALDAARRGASPELQARALSGLADVQYMDCRMTTALRHFTDCVDLCEAHGLTRIAVANRVMMGVCRIYTCEFDHALDDMRTALAVALRIGDRHSQIMAALSMETCLGAAGRYAEAENLQPQGLDLARAVKARRYEAIILCNHAEHALVKGLRAEALALARQARQISDETGPGFVGPIVLGLLGLLEEQRENQEAALVAAEALLERGAVGHNHFWFRRFAIERALLLEDWNEVHRHADALLLRMSKEPLAYASWVAQRAKILARRGSGSVSDADEDELNLILASAAGVDMRIDAFGELLRRM
jgi:class 3 adenylate cyclase/tetratricopeptide (TPR) repeat protein